MNSDPSEEIIKDKQISLDNGHKWERITANENKVMKKYLCSKRKPELMYIDHIYLEIVDINEELVCLLNGAKKLGLLKSLDLIFNDSKQKNNNISVILEKIGEQIGMMKMLNKLSLEFNNLMDSTSYLTNIKNIPNLSVLNLKHRNFFLAHDTLSNEQLCKQINNEFTFVSECQKLASFEYSFQRQKESYQINDDIQSAFNSLQLSKSLKEIHISNNQSRIDPKIYKQLGIALSNMIHLEYFHIDLTYFYNQQSLIINNDIGNGMYELMIQLQNSHTLIHLDISLDFSPFKQNITDSLKELAHFKNLTTLHILFKNYKDKRYSNIQSSLEESSEDSFESFNEDSIENNNFDNITQNKRESDKNKEMLNNDDNDNSIFNPIGDLINLRQLSLLFYQEEIPFQAFSYLNSLINLNNLEIGSYNFHDMDTQRDPHFISFVKNLVPLKSLYILTTHFNQRMKSLIYRKLPSLISLTNFRNSKTEMRFR